MLQPPIESWGELFLRSMNKVVRRKTSKYTTISNGFLRDNNLSLKAKGFLTVIMALPDDWDFSIKGICSVLKEGKTSVYSAVQELKENRYCKTTPSRDEKGLIIGLDYVFYEEPYKEEPNKEEPQQDNPHTENLDMDNMPQLNTKDDKEKNRTKDLPKERIDKSIPKKDANADVSEFVDRMYALYPAKCPKRGTSLGKSQKDKDRIKSLLKTYSKKDIEFVFRWEIAQKYGKTYMLNFSTFLNNFPDPTQIDGYNTEAKPSLPKGWEQERYDMYIRNGYTITEDGRLFKDGREIK